MIPGFLVSLLTFPGVVVHELAHALFCRIFSLEIYQIQYFKVTPVRGSASGFVLHKRSEKGWQNLLVSIGPFFLNTVVGAVIGAPAAIPVFRFKAGDPLDFLLIWLGVSIAMHAFPSTGDAAVIWRTIKRPETNLIEKLFGYPIVGLIYLGALGSMLWLDVLYGIAVVGVLPNLIVSVLA